MGNWAINITGTGAHHNKDNPTDANVMTRAFIQSLLDAGHDLSHASFTYGARELYGVTPSYESPIGIQKTPAEAVAPA